MSLAVMVPVTVKFVADTSLSTDLPNTVSVFWPVTVTLSAVSFPTIYISPFALNSNLLLLASPKMTSGIVPELSVIRADWCVTFVKPLPTRRSAFDASVTMLFSPNTSALSVDVTVLLRPYMSDAVVSVTVLLVPPTVMYST